MKEFRAKIGPGGRIVIPSWCRKSMHLKIGDDLVIHLDDDEMRLFTLKHSIKKAQQLVKQYTTGKKLTRALKKSRKEDFDRE